MWHSSLALALAASAVGVQAGSLKDIKHIVLFMQENRAFDHVCLLPRVCIRVAPASA